jgi:hypothetical protein
MNNLYKEKFNKIIEKFDNLQVYKKYVLERKRDSIYRSSTEIQYHYYCIKNNNIINPNLKFIGYKDKVDNLPKSW